MLKLAVEVALRAMRNFPWDRPVQQRSCLLLVRLLPTHGAWLVEHIRKDEGRRLRRVARSLKAQLEMDDEEDSGDEEDALIAMAAKHR